MSCGSDSALVATMLPTMRHPAQSQHGAAAASLNLSPSSPTGLLTVDGVAGRPPTHRVGCQRLWIIQEQGASENIYQDWLYKFKLN